VRLLRSASRLHQPVFGETTIYYIFTWSASRPIDIYPFASRLLSSGIAETVGSPAGPEVRISPDFAKLAKHVRKLQKLKDLKTINKPTEFVKWSIRDPRLSAQLVWHVYKNRKSGHTSPDPTSSEGSSLDDVEQQIKEIIASAQATNAIQHAIEGDLYSPIYLSSEPYLRLTLKDVPCWLTVTDGGIKRDAGDTSGGIRAEALLLVHKSGTIQLTFVLRLPDSLPTDSLVPLTKANSVFIHHSEVAEHILHAAARFTHLPESGWPGKWAEHRGSGCRWREIEHKPAVSLVDLFNLYKDAIEQAVKVPLFPEWFCYPVVFIDSLGCCNSERQWIRRHHNDLRRIVERTRRIEFREPPMTADRALTTDFSIYYEAGSTTSIKWKFTPEVSEFADKLQSVVIIEHVLLRYWQLVALNERIVSGQGSARSSAEVQAEAIYGLQEYRRSALVYGTAIDAANEVLSALREQKLYQHILNSLELLQQMIATESAKRASQTQNVIAGAAFLAAVILGLPSIQSSLDAAKSVPSSGIIGKVSYPLRVVAHHGATGVWLSYISLLGLVILAITIPIVLRRRPRLRLRLNHAPGRLWPFGTIRIIRRDVSVNSETEPSRGSARGEVRTDRQATDASARDARVRGSRRPRSG
jgi:hypothetical protein